MELQVVQIQKKQMSQRESHQHGRGMMRKDCRARHGGCRRRRRRRRRRCRRRRHRRRCRCWNREWNQILRQVLGEHQRWKNQGDAR